MTSLAAVREMRLVVYIDAGCGNILHLEITLEATAEAFSSARVQTTLQ
jgi:hypothetical protein